MYCVGYSSSGFEENQSLQLNKWKNMCMKHKDIYMCEYLKIIEYMYIYTYVCIYIYIYRLFEC
jgi:hypothetical protein